MVAALRHGQLRENCEPVPHDLPATLPDATTGSSSCPIRPIGGARSLVSGSEYEVAIVSVRPARDAAVMTKRMAAALLWFMTGWYAWALIAATFGLTPLFGPVLGTILAAFVAGDPMHRIWTPRASSKRINSRLKSISSRA